MERLTIRGASVELPSFEEDAELTSISTLRRGNGDLSNFVLNDLGMRALELKDAALRYGRISKLRTETTNIRQVDTRSIHFSGCDLGKLFWTSGKMANTLFEGCKLLGARFDGITFDNVAFVGCKLDYSAFLRVRVSGPVIFPTLPSVKRSLKDATSPRFCSMTANSSRPDLVRADTRIATYEITIYLR